MNLYNASSSAIRRNMKEEFIALVLQDMTTILNNAQLEALKRTLEDELSHRTLVQEGPKKDSFDDNGCYIDKFISSKRLEGCSEKSLFYYEKTITTVLSRIGKSLKTVVTDDLRNYLSAYQAENEVSKVTIDNVRRILSSFFSWLEDEDYILKSPARRIHKVKATISIKNTFSDEEIEMMRDICNNKRDLAIIDMLASTGMRVGEMVRLKRSDVNMIERECVVLGKGDKQRTVYFDARAKIHLQKYIESRNDSSEFLFVSLNRTNRPMSIAGVERVVKKLGEKVGLSKAHPHKFRRTLATGAIDKGMPIEQVQQLLGHKRIDTTLMYAMVKQANVKASYRRCIS